MHIAFDAKRAAQNRTGLGNYSRFVINALTAACPDDTFTLCVPSMARAKYLGELARPERCGILTPRHMQPTLWRTFRAADAARRAGADLFFGLSNELPLNIRRTGLRSVVTIHDIIYRTCPQYYAAADRLLYDFKYRRACLHADRIIAVSQFTKQEIVRHYGIAPDKIHVVYQGCYDGFKPAFVRDDERSRLTAALGLPPRFALYVGSIEERKNVGLAVRAMASLKRAGTLADIELVGLGRRTKYSDSVLALARREGLSDRVHFLYSVPFAHFPTLYRMAEYIVYPSRVEGFGIPLLEAARSGMASIACTGSCLEEAAGPGAVYVSPDSADEMARAILQLWTDHGMRTRIAAAGLAYGQNFEPQKLARELRETLEW